MIMASRRLSPHWKCLMALASVAALGTLPAVAASVTVKISGPTGNPLADAVVYALPKAGTRAPVISPRSVAIEQREREFVPYVTPVQVGTTVSFPNRDPLLHHVYSFSAAKSFEIKLYSGESPRGILFDKPGTVTLGCNIHDWMIGYIHVIESPYFGKTDTDGRARISDIVAGEFEIHIWHPTQRAQADAKPIRLEARTNAEIEFTVDAALRKKRFKPPLDGVRYK